MHQAFSAFGEDKEPHIGPGPDGVPYGGAPSVGLGQAEVEVMHTRMSSPGRTRNEPSRVRCSG